MLFKVNPIALPTWVGSLPLLRGGWSTLFWLVPIVGYLLFLRLYLQAYALSYGLDSASPMFDVYFTPMVGLHFFAIGALAILLWGGIWTTRCGTCGRFEPDRSEGPGVEGSKRPGREREADPRHVEVHYRTLLCLAAVVSVVGVFAISVFAEQDASWHQALVRDTIFTPTHIVLFFFTLPLLLILAVALFLYLMTRLPQIYNGGIPMGLLFALVGVGVAAGWEAGNEFGHSYYYAEETFSVPIHWGFVAAGLVSVVAMATAYDVLVSLVQLKKGSTSEDGWGLRRT